MMAPASAGVLSWEKLFCWRAISQFPPCAHTVPTMAVGVGDSAVILTENSPVFWTSILGDRQIPPGLSVPGNDSCLFCDGDVTPPQPGDTRAAARISSARLRMRI